VTLTNNLTFQLSDTGIILNDDSVLGVPFVDIDRVSGLDNAPYRETKRDHEGSDGGFMDAEFETGRDITLEGTVYAPLGVSLESYLDSLKNNWEPSTTLVPLYLLPDNTVGTRLVFVKPLGCKYDWDTARRIGSTSVQFNAYAEDPRIYDFTQTSTNIPIGAIVTNGFGFNLGFSFSFGTVSTNSDGQFVSVSGNRPTPPIFTISGPVTNPLIISDTLGRTMGFTITLGVGETLVIDTQYRTVRLNGTTNRRSTLTLPGWFMLQPGSNFIRFRAAAGSGTLNIAYRNAWR